MPGGSGQNTKDTYYLTGQDDIKTSESSSSNANIFLKPRTTQDESATISSLTLNKSDYVLIITGEWNGSYDFAALTINQMTVSADNTSLKIGGHQASDHLTNQTVTIQKIEGDKTLANLEVTQWGNLTIGAATVGSVTNDGTLNLRGTLTGAGGGAAISGNGAINVEVDNLSIMDYAGVTYTLADGTSSSKNYGFITGTQSLTIFDNISYNSEKVTINNSTNNSSATFADGKYSADYSDNSAFYVNDSWIFNADESSGASAYYVGANGVLNMDLSAGTGQLPLTKPVFSTGTLNIAAGTKTVDLSSIFTANNGGSVLTQTADALVSITTTGSVSAGSADLSSPGTVQINNAASFTNGDKKLSGGKLVLSGVTSATLSGDRTLSTNLELINTSLTLGTGDVVDYDNTGNLLIKVGTGSSIKLGTNRQSLYSNHVIEMAGGRISGTGDTSENCLLGLDFYSGGRINTTADSTIATNVGGHLNGTVVFDVSAGVTLTMTGDFQSKGSYEKSNTGTMLYKGKVFTCSLKISGGVFEYYTESDITHTAAISGAGSFTKSGTGSLTLRGDNTYSGGTTVDSGKLVVDSAGAIGTGKVTVNKGAVLEMKAMPNNWTAASLLSGKVDGTGTLLIATSGWETGSQALTTSFTGTLELASGIKFTFCSESTGNSRDTLDISTKTISKFILNGESILQYQGTGTNAQFNNLLVQGSTGAATLKLIDTQANEGNTVRLTGVTQLNNDLNLQANFGGRLSIAQLSGAGTLTSSGSNLNDEAFYTTINSLKDFTGDLSFTDTKNHHVHVKTGEEGKVAFGSLSAVSSTGGTFKFQVDTTTEVDTVDVASGIVAIAKGVMLTLGGDTASTSTLGTVEAHSDGNTIYLNETATLNTLSIGQGLVTLAGSGTYDAGAVRTMTAKVDLGNDWSGNVKIGGATSGEADILLNKLGREGSTITIGESGVRGHLQKNTNANNDLSAGRTEFGANLDFQGAIEISNGYTDASYDFLGAIKGGAGFSITRTAGGTNTYYFKGSVVQWDGYIKQSGTQTTDIHFANDADTIYTSISNVDDEGNRKGTMNLYVDQTEDVVKFYDIVNVSSLTTKEAKVEFHADTTVAGNVTAGGTIHVEDGTFTVGGTLNAIGKTLELSGASTRVGQGTEGKTTAKIRLEGTGNTVGTLDFGKNGYARGVLELGESSSTTAGALYMNNGVSISLEKDAALTIGDSEKNYHYTITGRGVGAQIGIAEGDALSEKSLYRGQFGENQDVKYIFSNVDVNVNKASAKNTLAYELDNSSLTNAGSGTLTVSNANNTITHLAADGGNVTLSESMSVNSISAKNEKVVTVSSGKTIDMAGGKVRLSTREGANATLTAKSDNALLQLQADTSFSISDMTLSGVKISAEADTEVVLSGVDTKGGVELAAGQFTMGDTVTLRSVQEPATKSGGYTASFSSDQLSGITLNNAGGASLTVDLGSLPESLTMGQTYDELTITLYGFTMDYTSGKGLIFAEDSWLGRLLADQGASEYVSGSIDSHEVAALANNNTVKVVFTSAGTGANVGTVIRITGLTIPETATSTLGLIALAALVTRRRRK